MKISGAEHLVRSLTELGVEYIFTVPGASIDPILDVLVDSGPEVIVCRHEQNAAFMAQAWGKITGRPGVCLVTAGPGATNAVTGIAAAQAERCPVILISGQISQRIKFKHAHQNIPAVDLYKPITKWSIEVDYLEVLPDILSNAFQVAMTPHPGAIHIAIPSNILQEHCSFKSISYESAPILGTAPDTVLSKAISLIESAHFPGMFIGNRVTTHRISESIRDFLRKHEMPVMATFEAAGAISRDLINLFMGRLGVFKNQPGDKILDKADVLLTVGYDPIEYDPVIWNKIPERTIINIDTVPAILDQAFHPTMEMIGDIALNLDALNKKLGTIVNSSEFPEVRKAFDMLVERYQAGKEYHDIPLHPLRLIHEVREYLHDDITVICDVGSHQYWWARHFLCFEPKYFLTSMGLQTMGIALPWAIATALARPNKKVFSISGDGSFLMSSMELETAVRLNLPIIHMVWEDNSYNLVKIQQEKKYHRKAFCEFGPMDMIKYAQSLGAKAFKMEKPEDIKTVLDQAFSAKGPVIISVPINYRDNAKIIETLNDYS
ncbi:MAG: acetolactate synthase AlsS [Parachlamydiales bacterium]|nr:acetolactate synthase AlsS [Parachlamydiales bacterium]